MAQEFTSGLPLTLTGSNIWTGGNLSNGKLLTTIGVPRLEVGYSKLIITDALQAELDTAGAQGVPFGNAVWYNRYVKSSQPNAIYGGIPTAANAVPKLAGILAYDAGYAAGRPVVNAGVLPTDKGKLVKEGYLHYKYGLSAAGGTVVKYADINDGTMVLFFVLATGDPVFAAPTSYASDGTPVLANCVFGGKIVELYPENKSVLVRFCIGDK